MRPLSLPCYYAATAWGWHFELFVAGSLLWGLAMYLVITLTARRGGRWAIASATGVWLASAIPLALLALLLEQRSIRNLMDPIHGSWALVWLDPLVLPALVVCCGLAWPRIPGICRWRSRRWLVACGAIGLAAGWAFHAHAAGAYTTLQDHSPTNMFHDLGAYFALFGASLYLVIPVLANRRAVGMRLWLIVAGLATVALLLLVHEAIWHLPPGVYHLDADWAHWGRAFSCVDGDG